MTEARPKGRASVSFCVIVPMLNEESNAERCVRAIRAVLESLPHRASLIVVDDGSTDRTGAILERLTREYSGLAVVTHKRNRGYGRAIQSGVAEGVSRAFDYALFMDSDLTNDPRHIPDFVRRMERGYDVIKASRYVPGGGMAGVPFHRVIISVIGNRITRCLMGLPITDCTNGFRAARLDLLRRIPFVEPGFAIIMEELYYLRYLAGTFCEVPYVLTSRRDDQTRSRFLYRPKVFWQYVKYPLRVRLGIRPKCALIRREEQQ